jgi:tetratricopeptide (TPR) repeat protein
MPVNPLHLSLEKAPAKRSLRVPLVLLAVLVAAFFLEIRWTRSNMAGLISLWHQTSSGWQKLPAPKGYTESLRVSSRGTVWVLTTTPAFMSRFDGAIWHDYKASDASAGISFLNREFVLDGEQIWVPTPRGMLHWDGENWHTDRSLTSSRGASIVAGGGEAWVIDSSGKLSHFAKGQWQSQMVVLPGVKWSPDAANPKLARTSDGTVWLMRQGLWRWDGAGWAKVTDGGDALADTELVGASGDRVWLFDNERLRAVSTDTNHWSAYTSEQTGLGKQAEVYEMAGAGSRTWFATSRGAIEFDGSGWRRLPLPGPLEEVRRVSATPDGTLSILGTPPRSSVQGLRSVIYLTGLTPLAILGIFGWIVWQLRRRQLDQHQLVTQAVQHATGEVPEELEAGANKLKSRGPFAVAFLWIGTFVAYFVLRRVWPQAPYWSIAVIGVTIHLLMTFQESLVKRKPQPSDPIGPGAPSRYNWAKSWQAVAGTAVVLLLVYLDRLPMLRFLRGYWWWVILLVPIVYQALAVRLLNGAMKRGDYEGALNIIRWTHFYNPSGMEPLRMSGHVLLISGRYREAEDTLRRSLASSQARESYGSALEYLGDALMEQGRYDEAMRSYEAALHAFPWRRRPYRGMAEVLLRRGEKPQQALEYIEKILDFSGISWSQRKLNGNPQDDYWSLKAWALARLGRTSEVADAIESALKVTNKSSAPDMAATHYRAGIAMLTMGHESAANEHFKLAMQFDPHGRRGTLAKAALLDASHVGHLVR